MNKLIPIALEIAGLIGISVGLGIEVACHADIGYAIFSAGGALVVAGGIIWGKFMRR